MALQHNAFERRVSARASVRNQLNRTRHSLEFRPEERLGLVSGCICHWIKKVFHCFAVAKESHKFHVAFDVELHGTDDDHELIARYNARCEALGMMEYDHSVLRLREAVHRAFVNRSRE